MNKKQNIWVVIPAAGIGRRMGGGIPKQYILLNDKTIIEHTLNIFDAHPDIAEIVIAISETDKYWPTLNLKLNKTLHKVAGGKERCDSVLNALSFLKDKAEPTDWVLVHDAARPCLRKSDLDLLLKELMNHNAGGILAVPVRDTMKRAFEKTQDSDNLNIIESTIDRENLWHALTPQMFRFGLLYDSLKASVNENKSVTDEASAVEMSGHEIVLVEGQSDNIKITRPEDVTLAAFYLRQASLDDQEGE